MKPKLYQMKKPKVTCFRVVCITCLLSLIFILNSELTTEPVRVKLSEILKMYTTSCAPGGHYDQFNPCLIKYVQENILLPPSGLPYTPSSVTSVGGIPVNATVDEKVDFIVKHFISKNPSPGFFIECGANDGMFLSPTLKLEREYNWTGVLIEGDPKPFKKLVALHRNAWMVNAALCTKSTSKMVAFYTRPNNTPVGGLNPKGDYKTVDVPCIPLYTLLAAMGVTTVDFFSLDVEGYELDILKTVPFDKVIFKVLMVEHAHVPGYQPAVIKFMGPNGYIFIGTLFGNGMQDSLFVHESVYTSDMTLKIKHDPNPGKYLVKVARS